jgi:hypothetical protein
VAARGHTSPPRIRTRTETRGSNTTSTFEYLGLSGAALSETRAGSTKGSSYDAYGQRISTTVSGVTHTYARNPHGDVSMLLGATGSATASYGYRPYGDLDTGLFAGDSDAVNPLNPYRFNDRRPDTGAESIDMGARRVRSSSWPVSPAGLLPRRARRTRAQLRPADPEPVRVRRGQTDQLRRDRWA